jgi:hypothetical protein
VVDRSLKENMHMKRALTVVLVLLGSTARADIFDALAVAGAAADVVTTETALRRGFVEQNIGNRGARVGANIALTGACLLAAHEVQRQGHRGWAKALKLTPAVLFGGMAIKNLSTMRSTR